MTTALQLETMEVEVSPALAIEVDRTCASDEATVAATIDTAIESLASCIRANRLRPVAPPRAIYQERDARSTRVTVAFPVASVPAHLVDARDVRVGSLEGGRALRFVHRGARESLTESYERIGEMLGERRPLAGPVELDRYAPIWEEYVGDPRTSSPAQLVTRIYLSLRSGKRRDGGSGSFAP